MIFPGGRPALVGVLSLLSKDVEVRVGNCEYAALKDILKGIKLRHSIVECSKENKFKPNNREYFDDFDGHKDSQKVLRQSLSRMLIRFITET